MIDPELDQLSRALIAATDRLNSEDFRERQARYIRDEQALRELADGLEADERAVEAAQQALTAHVAANYIDPFAETRGILADDPEGELFEPEAEITPIPPEEDEFATARRTGALS